MTIESWIPLAIATALGAVVGSFLNVCIYRLPRGASVVWPASACPECKRPLSWYENVPVISYAILRGRCRTCRTPLTIRYPIVEAITAAWFACAWWLYGPTPLFASRVILGCALLTLFAIDLEHYVLPDPITIGGIVVGFVLSFFAEPGWLASLLGILVGGGLLWAIAEGYYRIRHEEGMGGGDVKMLAMIGAFLGWKLTIISVVMASFAGSLVGVALILSGRGTMKYALPFGTFLAAGGAIAATVGPALLDWYLAYL
jgi:leader peptidase (prepilin peptidase) / N-methyltransferase